MLQIKSHKSFSQDDEEITSLDLLVTPQSWLSGLQEHVASSTNIYPSFSSGLLPILPPPKVCLCLGLPQTGCRTLLSSLLKSMRFASPLKHVKVSLDGIPSLQSAVCTTQLDGIGKTGKTGECILSHFPGCPWRC